MDEVYTTVRGEVRRYLAGDVSFKEFYHWMYEETWGMESDDPEYNLTMGVMLCLAEHTTVWNGQRGRTEEDCRVEFARLLEE